MQRLLQIDEFLQRPLAINNAQLLRVLYFEQLDRASRSRHGKALAIGTHRQLEH